MEVKPYLPHKIIENILSRIPVKYLCRFKSVCKQWNSTISDPRFSEIQLKQFKKSWSEQRLLAWEEERDFKGLYIAKLQKNKFQFVSVIEHPWEQHGSPMQSIRIIVCYCDGLYLKREPFDKQTYRLWNPSTRTYMKLSCPYLVDDHNYFYRQVFCGMCYDPLMKDYKIVIADLKHYAVFLCRNNKWGEWGEVKEMEECFSKDDASHLHMNSGISFNGSYYWMLYTQIEYAKVESEIICFDFGDEKFKKMHKPDFEFEYKLLDLASIGGHLCLLVWKYDEIRIMKKVEDEDSWIEFKILGQLILEQLPEYSFRCADETIYLPRLYYICSINEDEILLGVNAASAYDKYKYLLYDQSKDTFVNIQRNRLQDLSNPVPYLEISFCLRKRIYHKGSAKVAFMKLSA